jgi:hypothetical protein
LISLTLGKIARFPYENDTVSIHSFRMDASCKTSPIYRNRLAGPDKTHGRAKHISVQAPSGRKVTYPQEN